MAATRMQCDQHICRRTGPRLFHDHTMASAAKHARPAGCRMTVAVAAACRSRRDDRDFHTHPSQYKLPRLYIRTPPGFHAVNALTMSSLLKDARARTLHLASDLRGERL